jgi:hypothetical protein
MRSPKSTLDRWRVAQQMLDETGRVPGVAEANALTCIQGLVNAGDMDGAAVWNGVLDAIEELRRDRPTPSEQLH